MSFFLSSSSIFVSDPPDDKCNFIFCNTQETCQISSKGAAHKLGLMSLGPDVVTNDFNYHDLIYSLATATHQINIC